MVQNDARRDILDLLPDEETATILTDIYFGSASSMYVQHLFTLQYIDVYTLLVSHPSMSLSSEQEEEERGKTMNAQTYICKRSVSIRF